MRKCNLVATIGLASALQSLPPIQWITDKTTTNGFSLLESPKKIFVDAEFADVRDTDGLTLIPPTAYEFAETFRQDIANLFGGNWTLEKAHNFSAHGIHLGPCRGNKSLLSYEHGIATTEGYELIVGNGSVYIGGSGARGMFWGTRTLLQELLIAEKSVLSPGHIIDAPAYPTRGYMLDAGRKWYTPDFLKELCTYASFFKMSEFHYHSSDNYPLNRGRNETWNRVFSHFSLFPDRDIQLQGIIERKNETLSCAQFQDLQRHCAQRGVTIIPEIEAPGHALAITKWKPELALDKKDLLNLSHPDALPTVKAIWAEFLPWFQTKEVHIGADEYAPELADDYVKFVNDMALYINVTSGKRIRVWGTYEPSVIPLTKDIIVQHWQYGQSDPVQLYKDGYDIINSNDWWAYMSLKNDHVPILPAPYPQFYNVSRTLNFANVPGWQWEPSLYNHINLTQQLPIHAKANKGAILAAWSDNGPDATTQLEAFYALREGIPVMAARAWSGARGVNIGADEWSESVRLLASQATGQNLDRRMSFRQNKSNSSVQMKWARQFSDRSIVSLGKGSYGPPYTLTLNVSAPFTISGPDTTLSLDYATANTTDQAKNMTLVFTTADQFSYPLRSVSINDAHDPGHPGRIWTNQSTSTHHIVPVTLPARLRIETDVFNGSRVWINDRFAGRFEVFVFGGRNTLFSWSQMALVAPLDRLGGGVDALIVENGVGLS